MSDLNLPREQPLPEDRKRAMREELLAAVETEAGSRRTRAWLVPGLAAAAVLGIVGVGVALAAGGDESGGTTIQPAATSDRSTPDESTPPEVATPSERPRVAEVPSEGWVVEEELPDGTITTYTAPPVSPTATEPPTDPETRCDSEVTEFARLEPSLKGATVTAERGDGPAATFLYETKTAWVVCDEFAAADGGAPTLLNFHQKSADYVADTSTLAISENHVPSGDAGLASQYLAAGRDFDGVEAISYSFPDGHTEDAVVGQNGLWSMAYLPDGQLSIDDPITVTVAYTRAAGGETDTFRLEWGLDTCAQLNHGC